MTATSRAGGPIAFDREKRIRLHAGELRERRQHRDAIHPAHYAHVVEPALFPHATLPNPRFEVLDQLRVADRVAEPVIVIGLAFDDRVLRVLP